MHHLSQIPGYATAPNSPDLNPVDYKVCSVMQEKVYKKRIKDIGELRARILTAWDEMDQRIIDAAIRQWRTRLRTCIKAKGGHFEHTIFNIMDKKAHLSPTKGKMLAQLVIFPEKNKGSTQVVVFLCELFFMVVPTRTDLLATQRYKHNYNTTIIQ